MKETSNSRILTTREDYLVANEDVLSIYYDKKIKCWGNCLWNLDTSGYDVMETLGGIDAVTYDKASDTVYIWGWAAFKEKNADDSICYIYIDTGLHRYYFRTGKSERNDIAQTLNNQKYLNCGFSAVIGNIHEWIGDGSEIVIGLSIIDDKGGYANEEVSEQRISID